MSSFPLPGQWFRCRVTRNSNNPKKNPLSCAAILLATLIASTIPGVAEPGAADRLPIKDFADNQCIAYSNAKAIFSTDAGQPICKIAFGTGDGIFGGFWIAIKKQTPSAAGCRGMGLTVRGNGDAAGSAYVYVSREGASYRSKNINYWFANKQWHDVALAAADFIIDPEWAKTHAEQASALPKQPDWQNLERMQFAAVNFGGEPTLEIKSVYFFLGEIPSTAEIAAAATPQPTSKPPASLVKPTGPVPLAAVPGQAMFPEGPWLLRHEKFVARAKEGGVDLLWVGDSITDRWNQFKGTYNKSFAGIKAANFGIGGDKTQNLLWRLENGELEGITPKAAVLLIGTNNVQWDPPAQIAAAISKIVQTIRTKSPNTKILLMGLFPRGDLPASSPGQQSIKEVNEAIAKLDDGKSVHYLDISAKLANPDGTIIADAFLDRVHPSPKGFSIWAESIRPVLDGMMK